MPRLPNAQELAAAEAVLVPGTTYWASLHTADPGTTGASEVSGGSYARQSFTVQAVGGNTVANVAAVNFAGLPVLGSGAPFVGVWSASSGGTFISGGTVSGLSGAIAAGATAALAIGAIVGAMS